MGRMNGPGDREYQEAVSGLLGRLWQTKQKTVDLVDAWSRRTPDAELYAGLHSQLTDERRQVRLIGEEIKQRGGSLSSPIQEQLMSRPFALVKMQSDDVFRLCALHKGIKGFTVRRLGQMVPYVDQSLARLIDQMSREDARHIRWADIRISRSLGVIDARQCDLIVNQLESMLEGIWLKPWRQLTQWRQVSRAS